MPEKDVKIPQFKVAEVADVKGTPMEWKDAITAARKTRLTSPKTLVICGFAYLSRSLAPYDRRTCEIWGCNEAYTANYMVTKDGKFRADRWFQMHLEEDWSRDNNPNDPQHPKWLAASHNFPIVMQETFGFPSAEAFPLDECDEIFFGNAYAINFDGNIVPWLEKYKHGYYSSTFVYMLAYAVWQKETGVCDWDNIDIYGFHTASQSEYFYQKPGAEFWIAQAMARGINIRVVENSPLLHGEPYGYVTGDALLPSHVEERIEMLEAELPGLRETAFQQHGARLMLEALRDESDYLERLPELANLHSVRQQEELAATSSINFYLSAKANSEEYLKALTQRHGEEATGAIDRMTLEVQKAQVRDMVVDVRALMDAVAGALSECRMQKEKYGIDAEIRASFEIREVALVNKLIERTAAMNNMLGLISNIEWFIVRAEGRTPNFTDEHEFGFMVQPDLFDPRTDVLTLGEDTDGKTREEEPATEADESGAGSSAGEPSESA